MVDARMVRLGVWLTALTFALGLIATACAPSRPRIRVRPKPLPPGIAYTGKWYSPQYENMTLKQEGDTVTGTFSYKTGGTLEGKLDGNVLIFDWIQPGDTSKARREVRGRGYFIIRDDGDKIRGWWGYNDDLDGGGIWDADRIEERKGPSFDVDDPIF